MAKAIHCPFFEKDTPLFVLCEGIHSKSFKDKEEKKQYVKCYCGNKAWWIDCINTKELLEQYENEE